MDEVGIIIREHQCKFDGFVKVVYFCEVFSADILSNMKKKILIGTLVLGILVYGCNSIWFSEVKDYNAPETGRSWEEWQEYWEVGQWKDEEKIVNGAYINLSISSSSDSKTDTWSINQTFLAQEEGVIVEVNDMFVTTESGEKLDVIYPTTKLTIEWDESVGYYRWYQAKFAQFELDYGNSEALSVSIDVSVTNRGETIRETRKFMFYPEWRNQNNFAM